MKNNQLNVLIYGASKLGYPIKSYVNTYKRIEVKNPSNSQIQNILNNYQSGNLKEAIRLCKMTTKQFPSYQFAWKLLGIVLASVGDTNESLTALKKAIEINSMDAEAYFNLGVTYGQIGKLKEAEECYFKAKDLRPDFAEAYNNLGVTLKDLNQLIKAELYIKKAISLRTNYVSAYFNLANTQKKMNKFKDAEHNYKQAIYSKNNYPEAHNNLGVTLQEVGRFKEAKHHFQQAIKLKPKYAEAHRNLADIKTFNKIDDQIILMQKLVLDKNLSKRDKGNLFFALGKCFEELKDFRSSYEYYSQGNFLIKKVLKYNFQQDSNLFEQVKTNFIVLKESNINVISKSNHVAPIFIVGMPRSGTTLVEQIISSNSKIFGGGELPFIMEFCSDYNLKFKNLNENILIGFRSNYLNKLKNISKGENIITDKMPQNFLYIGIIAMIFPEAKIINVKRHPAAVCWSNYKQFFVSKSMGYSYDLEDLVKYYYNYIHLMNFWETQFPNKIYNLNYDLLTENKEFETKKLFDYLDIDFETSSLSPHKNKRIVSTASNLQVRNEVYKNSSVEWKKFKPFLKGILDKLDHL